MPSRQRITVLCRSYYRADAAPPCQAQLRQFIRHHYQWHPKNQLASRSQIGKRRVQHTHMHTLIIQALSEECLDLMSSCIESMYLSFNCMHKSIKSESNWGHMQLLRLGTRGWFEVLRNYSYLTSDMKSWWVSMLSFHVDYELCSYLLSYNVIVSFNSYNLCIFCLSSVTQLCTKKYISWRDTNCF